MIQKKVTESEVEHVAHGWFADLGYNIAYGPDISPGGDSPERESHDQVVLRSRLESAVRRLNPDLPSDAIDEAVRKVCRTESPNLIENNRRFHTMITDGVDVEYHDKEGNIKNDKAWLINREAPEENDWLAVNQFTVVQGQNERRPDIVLFLNGLPLGVIELKNPADENATVKSAFRQLQTYKNDIPGLFRFNESMVAADGIKARMGAINSNWEWFLPWRTIDGTDLYKEPTEDGNSTGIVQPGLQTVIQGVFEKRRFIDLIHNFVVFEDDGALIQKKISAYHQFHAVNKAVECTEDAVLSSDDQRIGVVWHTQGSGKSLSMLFYAGKVIRHPTMENPTLVVITDRNDLDGQLYGQFSMCRDLIRQTPVQAESRRHLRELLKVPAGGVVFTTIQKFFPEEGEVNHPLLSERENIVVIADEAHRSQYGFIDGFARHMHDALPEASFIGFTGTPIEHDDKSTPAVFGDYIDTYDILQAVEDGATVPIYYEGRLAKIELDQGQKPRIDPQFEEITEEEEQTEKKRIKTKWARLEKMVGTDKRLGLVAEDLVQHFEERLKQLEGKGLIVGMSRRICVELYNKITKLRPEWHGEEDGDGEIKVVMSGSASDPVDWQQHIRNKARREMIAKRFKDPEDPLKLVIVRDMWLTGFDCPPLHTMYVDKPMSGHNLMQAIARVNRVFKDKPGGLVVDYLGLAEPLKRALANYTESGGRGKAAIDQEEAVAIMKEKYEIVSAMFHGFDYEPFISARGEERMQGLANASDHVLQLDDGKERYLQSAKELSKAFALAVPHDEALAIQDEVGFFQEVRGTLAKHTVEGEQKTREEMDTAIKQLVSRAVSSNEVVDIFASAGLKKPDISILSDEFLEEVRQIPQRNLAVETLRKLLNDEIKTRSKKNVVQARSFSEMLEETIRKYQNRSIEAATVITELIELAKEMRDAQNRGEELGLSEDEVAFYDALGVNDSAVKVLGDDTLRAIAQELVRTVRRSVTIDWTKRESARAKIRVLVKRILRKYGYPPDKQEKATKTVLQQAEVLCKDWAA
ncbi:DEAD/DEAH box helicase [candidate division MSBL1 archaeon SCGC-AAA382A20]|uniref:type I site-specific deoxyribonuclease n=1 Tax=candidate division MSBL1 archaeon SCGC-AAA382A20 TaxID=1698280 RepID=A0A133VKW0_9EURY|nr:DEAD/DEAH box helicase [candidate division MSBL1 archaeon SCGC-AAA382A20]